MNQVRIADPNDCTIHDGPSGKSLVNADGSIIFTVSRKWTKEEIMHVLELMNDAFDRGFHVGQWRRSHDIKKLLDL